MTNSTYGQFCPVAQASEILAERWTPLVLRELLCGSHHFNELRNGVPLMSPSLLSKRLSTLQDAGIVERREEGDGTSYHLTAAGEALRPIIMALGHWGHEWLQRTPTAEELDAGLLMWDIRRRIRTDAIPGERVVVAIRFPSAAAGEDRWWLVLTPDDVDLCLRDPGYEVDLYIEADLLALTEVWLGHRSWTDALEGGDIIPHGPSDLARAFPRWLQLSVFA